MSNFFCIDLGNSTLSAARFQGLELLERMDLPISSDLGGAQQSALQRLAAGARACVYASVSPQGASIIENLRTLLGAMPFFALNLQNSGLESCYKSPERLGADRVANALAAYGLLQSACVVIDAGSATHFDVIDNDGRFLGGPIAPGLFSSMMVFQQRATHLADFEIGAAPVAVASNTLDALNTGALLFCIGGIQHTLHKINESLGFEAPSILTGGAAKVLYDKIENISHYEPNLTLCGIARYAQGLLQRGLI